MPWRPGFFFFFLLLCRGSLASAYHDVTSTELGSCALELFLFLLYLYLKRCAAAAAPPLDDAPTTGLCLFLLLLLTLLSLLSLLRSGLASECTG